MTQRPAPVMVRPALAPRRLLARLHLWLGLGIGLLFGLLGLSGSVLVFHTPLLVWQHPQLAGHRLHADGEVLARLMEREAGNGLRALDLPRAELPVWLGYFEDGSRRYFAPADGRLLLSRNSGNDWLMWLHDFHIHLLAGEAGKRVLGIVGCLCLLLLLLGLYLWWPKRGRLLAQLKVHAQPPVRRWLSWHRSAGALSLPWLLLAVVTGLGMVYSDAYSKALTTVFGGASAAQPAASAPSDARPDFTRVLALAHAALPDAKPRRVNLPKPGQDEVSVRAQAAGEWHPNGRSVVVTDRGGRVLRLRVDSRQLALGQRMGIAIYPLHIGAVGGAPVRWLTAVAGLLPMGLFVTGLLFWLRRRRR